MSKAQCVDVAWHEKSASAKLVDLPSYKQLVWLLLQEPTTPSAADLETLHHIGQDAWLTQTYQLAQQFRTIVLHYQVALLDPWLDTCASSNLTEFVTFATGIRHDYASVRAALATHCNNEQTERQVNRLKLLKRQMYGRAHFDLLR